MAEPIVLRNYSKAHRHGNVVGQLPGGHTIPFGPYSLTQVGVFTGAFALLYLGRGLWMHFGRIVDVVLLLGIPLGLAIAERFVRPEGRSPLRTVAALARYLCAPRGGRLHGRALHRRPPLLHRAVRIYVQDHLPAVAQAAAPAAVLPPARPAPTAAPRGTGTDGAVRPAPVAGAHVGGGLAQLLDGPAARRPAPAAVGRR